MATESISKKFYRVCTDAVNRVFDRIAFWTLDSQVENESNGMTLNQTVGSIRGITSARTNTVEGYALDAVFAQQATHIQEFTVKGTRQSSDPAGTVYWESNTGSSEFPYKAVFPTTLYEADADPDWCLKTASRFPSATEKVNNGLIQIAEFTGTQVIFYASDLITTDVTLRVKGL